MKTFSIILILFVFGTFGWFGLENKKHIDHLPKLPKKENTNLKIRLAENNCAKLELEIQKKQNQISEILKKQP